jgi:hypothetical protein
MTAWEIVLVVVFLLLAFLYLIGSAIWVSRDAPKRGITNGMPAVLAFLMGQFGLAMWLAMRPPLQEEEPNDKFVR